MKYLIKPSLVYIFAALTGLLCGYNLGVISGAIIFIKTEFCLDSFQEGMIVSSLIMGAIFGSLFFGRFSDYFGRRKTIFCIAGIFVIGSVALPITQTYAGLFFARSFVGLGLGASGATVPTYLSELSPAKKRGMISGLFSLLLCAGYLFAYIANYLLDESDLNWRLMLSLSFIPSVLVFVACFFIPESPRYLIKINQFQQAKKIIMHFNGNNEEDTTEEIQSIISVLRQEKGGLRDLFGSYARLALIVGICLAIFSHFLGLNVIAFYVPTILLEFGFDLDTSLVVNIFLGVAMVVATYLSMVFSDRLGRKPLLIAGSIICAAMLLLFALALGVFRAYPFCFALCMIAIVSFQFFYFGTWNTIIWLLMGEFFPLSVRGLCTSIVSAVNFTASLVIALGFPVLQEHVSPVIIFCAFAGVGIFAAIYVKFNVFETRGKSLEEIEETWAQSAGETR